MSELPPHGAAQTAAGAVSNRVRVALLVSLGLNLFLAGLWIGDLMHRGLRPPPGPMHQIMERIEGRLSVDGQRRVRAALIDLDRHRPPPPANPLSIKNLVSIVETDPFDRVRFLSALEAMNRDRLKVDQERDERIADLLAALTLADRRALAEVLAHLPPPPPPPPPR